MKFHRLFPWLGLIAMLALNTACSQFFGAPSTPTRMPILIPTITPILVIMPSPTSAPIPTTTPIATLSLPTSAPATSTPVSGSTAQAKRINFAAGGASTIIDGTAPANGSDRYVLRALAGQELIIKFTPSAENVTLQISGADGSVLASGGAKFTSGTFLLTVTQDYFISVVSSRDTPTNFKLQIAIPPLVTATLTPSPTSTPRRITFATGAISATVTGSTFTSGQDRFIIRALSGQTMTVNVTSPQGPVILIIYGADGNVLISDHAGVSNWSGVLPSTQDYMIDTRSVGADVVAFTLTVTIPPK